MSFFELSKKISKGGRRGIKMSLLEIHSAPTGTNKNGLHWKRQFVLNNIATAKGIPICAEFTDETKTIPLDHGFTEISEDNEPLFTNSEVVGTIENAYITTANIKGEEKEILCGEGYIYQQRYPNFTKWLEESITSGTVRSSIEIMGTDENKKQIVYENGNDSREFRTPEIFSFSGTAILSVEAADDAAVILDMNSIQKKEGEKQMDEKTISLIVEAVKNAVNETNSKNAEYTNKLLEVNSALAEKDKKIVELNASVEQLQKALDDLKNEQESYWAERDILEKELAAARVEKRLSEMNNALKDFSEEQLEFAKSEIEAFKQNPTEVEISSITDKIYQEIGKKAINSEINSIQKQDADGNIFGDIISNGKTIDKSESIFATISEF